MEAGVAVAGPRPSFRKPSHDTSQRNYRRRSPSHSSRSTSSSPSPTRAPTGGGKRDRSKSPSSPGKDDSKVNSVQAKKGRTAHKDDDSDKGGSPGRRDYQAGTSDRGARSHDRYEKFDSHESRRSSAAQADRSNQLQAINSSRDAYGDTRRSGDYDHSRRGHSPDRGHRDKERRRDVDRDSGRSARSKVGSREGDGEKETVREGKTDREKIRDRDRSRSRLEGRDNKREREREREKDRDRERDNGRIKSRHGDKDGETDRNRFREKERGRDRYDNNGGRDLGSPRDLDVEWKSSARERDRNRERDRDRGRYRNNSPGRDVNMERESEYEKDGSRSRRKDSGREKEKTRSDGKAGRDAAVGHSDKDLGRDRGRGREHDAYSIRDDTKGQELPRQPDVDLEDDLQDRRTKVKDENREGSRPIEKSGEKDRTRNGEKDDPKGLIKVKDELVESGHSDLGKVKEETSPPLDSLKVNHRQDDQRVGSRNIKDEIGSPYRVSELNSPKEKERAGGKAESNTDVGLETEGRRTSRDKGESSERSLDVGTRDKGKDALGCDPETGCEVKKERQSSSRRSDVEGNFRNSTKDGEATKDRSLSKRDSEKVTEGRITAAPANETDKKSADSKGSKGSKWGPEPSDLMFQGSGSEEVANDLSAAKLAALKAAELVNKNLGVPGFMSADQKKKLLWGGKKSAVEQEQTVAAAGSNRWDTVHFSDPDRQEKFHKLMGVKADSATEGKREGETEAGLFTEEKQRELQLDLEKQFAAGLRRRDGRTVGLGL
ncbi:hypothetical protein R1sor_012678 [Riccia sorocarpa]|uniref:Small acidic protein-like domain-containing protein n=1 Tax=Riccia sorocarpa TaxID=122646 RepID=A0ABD3I739_9MARC